MTAGQRFVRVVTTVVVRVPFAWRFFRGPLTRSFDRLAPGWEGRISDERLAPVRGALGALTASPSRVLDLGTGTGRVARVVAELWPESDVVGADLSPGMIDEARRIGGRVHYDVADASALPYEDGGFDLVTLSNMIPFFDEVARVTAPAGSVIVAFTMGDRTPIFVPFERVRAELERRGFSHVADFDAGTGTALLAKKADRS